MPLAIYGALCMGHLAVAALFLRVWSKTRAPLLAAFAVAFSLMALSYLTICFSTLGEGSHVPGFLLRLGAFTTILLGIGWVNFVNRD